MTDHEYNESEKPALDTLSKLGWDVYDIKDQSKKRPDYRESYKEFLLIDELKSSIKRLNPWIKDNNIDKAVRHLRQLADKTLDANQKFHKVLVDYHYTVLQDLGSGKKNQTVKFIDWKNPTNNRFFAFNQYKIQGKDTINPDITLFVNGLPLAIIECKSPYVFDPEAQALEQLMRYQNLRGGEEGIEEFFTYIQMVVGMWGDGAIYGTYKTPKEYYIVWKDPYPAKKDQVAKEIGKINKQDITLYSLFKPERFLDIIKHYILFEHADNRKIKIIARYQQYRATEKAIKRIKDREQQPTQGGVVWHTQGSGKSLTMLFLAMKLRTILENPTLLLITDRVTLDNQISDTFSQCGYTVKQAQGADDIKEKMSKARGQTVTSLMQKFPTEEGELFPVLNESKDIYIFADEAHRTQEKKLGNNLRTAFPNAFYIGFTGTPIEKKDRNTRKTFGNYIDTYTIDQSIEDGATLPIFYQGRLADMHLEGEDLDELFDRIFADKTEEEKKKIKQKYATEREIARAPKRIKKICLDIIKHFEEHVAPPFKAMIVTGSKLAAARYKKTLDELNGPSNAMIVSEGHNDDPLVKKYFDETDNKKIKKEFKDPNSNPKIVVVCGMLITGYDVPVAQVMYLDDSLKEHNLLQAIARVNRPYEDKTHGLIIDYNGISDNLDEALSMFSSSDVENVMMKIEDEKKRLASAHRDTTSYFDNLDKIEECVQNLEEEKKRKRFHKSYRNFAKIMDIAHPNPIVNPYKKDFYTLGKIYYRSKNLFRDESMNLRGAGKKVRKLIEDYVTSSGIKVLNEEPVSILDRESYEEHLKKVDKKEKRIEMEQAIKREISVQIDKDPVFYQSLHERLEEIIKKYREKRLSEKNLLSKYKNIMSAMRARGEEAQEKGLESTEQLPFYDILEENLLKKEEWVVAEKEIYPSISSATKKILKIIDEEKKPNWVIKSSVQRDIRKKIKLYLTKHYDLSYKQIVKITKQIMSLARVHFG
ncbi:HsdR family type I site-specific deoxyribonuclease [Candidatus Woesearchaeota archaeon]|nr:HsdR family type I site-specific deoxyribonuclease [Candidatus Woesearchaeota archaeon]